MRGHLASAPRVVMVVVTTFTESMKRVTLPHSPTVGCVCRVEKSGKVGESPKPKVVSVVCAGARVDLLACAVACGAAVSSGVIAG